MKVLNILYQAYPYVSGSTVRFHDLNENYQTDTNGIYVHNIVLPFYNFENHKQFKRGNLRYHFLKGPKNTSSLFFNIMIKIIYFPILALQLAYVVKKISPDLVDVHAMTYSLPGIIFSRLILDKNLKIVFNCRSVWHINKDKKIGGILRKIILNFDRTFMKQVDGIIFISEDVKNYYNITKVKSIILGNRASGIPLEHYTGKPSFGYVGSILENEGIHLTIEAFKIYRARGGVGELRIWGSGYYLESIRLKYANVEGLCIMGEFLPWERKEIYSNISHIINFRLNTELSRTVTPIKSLECIMYGRQLIASDVSGIRNSIPKELNQFATFVEPENIGLLADTLLKCDIEEMKIPKQINLLTLQKYNWSGNCTKQYEFYRSLVN